MYSPFQGGETLQGRSSKKGHLPEKMKEALQQTLQVLHYMWSEPPMELALTFNKQSTTRVLEFPVMEIPVVCL